MPRPKLTDEDRIKKAHENMLNGMMLLYTKALEKDKEQYMRLKIAYGFLADMLKQLDEKYNGKN
tara:strand:+ start:105 stop:296 length:192 start_codon:yes stop_codon:yes gene_type:complete